MALFRLALGERDRALDELERASAENSAWLYAMDVDPKLDPLRGAARFRRLQKRAS
jgi:hypothetical protein